MTRHRVRFLHLVATFLLVQHIANAAQHGDLHELMTEEELAFYLGVVSAAASPPEYQVIFLAPALALEQSQTEDGAPHEVEELRYDFTAFNMPIALHLRRNTQLMAPAFTTLLHDGERRTPLRGPAPRCHFLQHGSDLIAAISMCEQRQVRGLVLLPNDTLQISPLSPRLRDLLVRREALEASEGTAHEDAVPHLVRRAPLMPHSMLGDALPLLYDIEAVEARRQAQADEAEDEAGAEIDDEGERARFPRAASDELFLELAVFFDEAAYKMFAPFLNNDKAQMRDMLLAYMNAIQALYLHPSLGRQVTLAIVRLELFQRQPSDLPHYNGERGQLLDSFCAYTQKHNPGTDKDPAHWDMGLYISGLDFFAYEGGRQSGVTMGLATVGGVCTDKYACVIAEFGTVNQFGKPYPSAGFTSVYVSAHEMGHNLGMHHDSSGNNCPKEGYVMSPSRGTNGETQWSSCSASVLRDMSWAKCLNDKPGKPNIDEDHARFKNIPGQFWGAKRQCEVLLRDRDATLQNPDQLGDICENLRCKTPHRSGFYFAGPALEGTACGPKLWCQGGQCVAVKRVGQQKPITEFPGGWSEWKNEACNSGCTTKSKGYQSRRRTCDNPKPINTDQGCDGPSYDVILCDDAKTCKNKRMSPEDYATMRCREFSKLLKELDPQGKGLQAPYEEGRLWMSCSVFCRRKDTGAYYTPRLDLNDFGVDPYFPDGTLCHNDGKQNFFCLQHHCLPENFKEGRLDRQLPDTPDGDVGLAQNAGPHKELSWPEQIVKYLSLDNNGKSLLNSLGMGRSEDGELPPLYPEQDWEDSDYREIPH